MIDLHDFMASFCLRREARAQLPDVTQRLVDKVAPLNRNARAATYAFLDAAWGHTNWQAEGVTPSVLRELRNYDLRADPIRESWHIDARYGAFFGSADPALLRKVVELTLLVGLRGQPLFEAARRSLNSLREQYPHIKVASQPSMGDA